MIFKGRDLITTAMVSPLLIVGLALTVGCQSSPQTEDEPPPAQPIEDFEESDDPYDEPHQDRYDEPGDDPYGEPTSTDPEPTDPMAPPQADSEPIDDETLDAFVDAYLHTEKFGQEVEQKMREAESYEEAQQIQEQAMADLEEEVESTGMDFQEFLMIADRLERDPDLQQRLETRLQQRGALPQ